MKTVYLKLVSVAKTQSNKSIRLTVFKTTKLKGLLEIIAYCSSEFRDAGRLVLSDKKEWLTSMAEDKLIF